MSKSLFLAAGNLLAIVTATPAAAQATAAPAETAAAPDTAPAPNTAPATDAADADETGNDNETIVVTAQLREQRPIEVPFALTAYSGQFLDELGIQEFEDLARYMPGFAVQNQSPNNPGVSIRGITSDSGDAFFEPRVSIYQDGVSISKPRGSYVELFDVERVEISKGPQSTLYGRGALIGAVNIVQAKPDLTDTLRHGPRRTTAISIIGSAKR